MTWRNEVLDSLFESDQTKAGVHKKVLGENLLREVVLPKKAKEYSYRYVTYFSEGRQQYPPPCVLFWQCILTTFAPRRRVSALSVLNQGLSCDCSGQQSGTDAVWLPTLGYKEDIASPWLSCWGCSHLEPSPHVVGKPRSQGEATCTCSGRQLQQPASTTKHVREEAFGRL